jgi:hypothetical protein
MNMKRIHNHYAVAISIIMGLALAITVVFMPPGSDDGEIDRRGAIEPAGIHASATTFTPEWNRTWSGNGWEFVSAVAVDSDGFVYVAGAAKADPVLNLTDACIAKYDQKGKQEWNRTLGDSNRDWAEDVAVGKDGVYVAWCMMNPNQGNRTNAYFSKLYKTNGTPIWNATWDLPTKHAWAKGIVVTDDAVYTCGNIEQNIGSFTWNLSIAKYDLDGKLTWQRTWKHYSNDEANSLAVDASDNLYVAGKLNNYPLIAKFSPSGDSLWNTTLAYDTYLDSIVADQTSGESYAVGFTEDYGHLFANDVLLVKCSASGTILWRRTWGSADDFEDSGVKSVDYGMGIALLSNKVYITGYLDVYNGDLGGITSHVHEAFILEYDTGGGIRASYNWSVDDDYRPWDMAASDDGIYLVGELLDPADQAWGCSGFIAKFTFMDSPSDMLGVYLAIVAIAAGTVFSIAATKYTVKRRKR